MGTFKQGIHGNFSGKVGNVVGSSWKGKGVMRIRPASVSNPRTEKQQSVRGKFALVGRFTARLSSLIADGFKSYAIGITAHNAAMMYNLKYGLNGVYPDLSLNMNEMKISLGDLPLAMDLSAIKSGDNALQLSWTDNSSEPGAAPNDLLSIGIYDVEREKALKFRGQFQRAQSGGLLEIPAYWLDRTLHVFAFFKSQTHDAGSEYYVSESIYLGSFDMSS